MRVHFNLFDRFKQLLFPKKGTKTAEIAKETQAIDEIVKIYTESARFIGLVNVILDSLDENKKRRYMGRVSWYKEQLDISMQKLGFTVLCNPDIEYDSGMAVQIQNIGDFDVDDTLVIEKWLEPTIISQDGNILNQGIAIARRK